jgi:two-component system KDP operon response regulator KdpE
MSESSPSVVVVEDEAQIRRFVRTAMEAEGWRVFEAGDIKRGLIEAGTRRPDLIILDLGLPDGDGVDLIRDLRTWSHVPVIVLSARSDEQDKIEALDAGADDYLTKPFGVGELLARVRVAQRRMQAGDGRESVFRFGDVAVDLAARVVSKAGQAVHLTPLEYRLLTCLIANAGKVLTHRQLLLQVPAHLHVTAAPETRRRRRAAQTSADGNSRGVPPDQLNAVGVPTDPASESDDGHQCARHSHVENRAPVGGLDVDAAVVGLHDLLDDVEPQAETLAATDFALAAAERVEDVRADFRRYAAGIRDAEPHCRGMAAVELDSDGAFLAMLMRVADEVGGDLREAVRIPFAGKVARAHDFDAAIRDRGDVFLHDAVDERAEISGFAFEDDAAREACARQVEHVFDHAAHALAA